MPDVTSEIFEEHQLSARVERLTDKVEFLKELDADRWDTTAHLCDEIQRFQRKNAEIFESLRQLRDKKVAIGQRLGVFTRYVIKQLNDFEQKLKARDEAMNELINKMGNLSL